MILTKDISEENVFVFKFTKMFDPERQGLKSVGPKVINNKNSFISEFFCYNYNCYITLFYLTAAAKIIIQKPRLVLTYYWYYNVGPSCD